jgi:hypothetical protein
VPESATSEVRLQITAVTSVISFVSSYGQAVCVWS